MSTNYFRFDGWVKSAQGPAVPGAQIYVCTQPANATALPPTPLANVFSDVNGLVPITQPILTDGFGHFDFYAAAAVYTIVVGLGGIVQQVYPDQSIGGASGTTGGGGGTALSLQTNGVSNSNQLVLNLKSSDGSVVLTSNSDGSVNVQAQSTKFNTAGQGWFYGAQDLGPVQNADGIEISTDGTVVCVQVVLESVWVISSVALVVVTANGSANVYAGLYTEDGNTKLIDTGALQYGLHSQQVLSYSLPSKLTLQPGVYWFAFATDTSGNSSTFAVHDWPYILGAILNNWSFPYSAPGPLPYRFGSATNVLAAGALPTTLGAINPYTGSSSTGPSAPAGIPVVMFQV